jgi:alpha-beta hydrolase superfamily lysophospholipase
VSKTPAQFRWLPNLLTRAATMSGIGYFAAAYTVSRWLTKPSPCKLQSSPSDLGLLWEPLTCRTADGLRLAGWSVAADEPRATIVVCHGVRQNRLHTLARIEMLVQAGYRCVAFDHRAHGESAGRRTSFGYHEARDVEAILDVVAARWPHQPMGALGISMGAAALCFAASRTRFLKAIVLESLYHDIVSAFINRIHSSYPAYFRKLARGVFWITEKRLGCRAPQVAPVEHIGKLAPASILLLTGTEDQHATAEDLHRLANRCQGPRDLWLVPGAGHKDIFDAGGQEYRARVLQFFEQWLFREKRHGS